MIIHCVFCNFKSDVTAEARLDVLQKLADFSQTLDGVLGFEFGPNRDFEQKSPDYSDGFVIRFTSPETLAVYAKHPTHQALGAQLVGLTQGGADGIMVFDLET